MGLELKIWKKQKSNQSRWQNVGNDYLNGFWEDTDKILHETFRDQQGLNDIKIERAHRVTNSKMSTRYINVSKLSSYKVKVKIKNTTKKLKG